MVLQKAWKVYLIHHTHLDIGYTHPQMEVLQGQMDHINHAMELIEKSKNYPIQAQFRWNPECTWAVEEWMKNSEKSQYEKFVNYVHSGHIGLDGFFLNMLTGLMRPMELMELFRSKNELEERLNFSIDSAMITDIPGMSWGMVKACEENGIKYISTAPNRSDRIGKVLKIWGDKPFYWTTPRGEKVLVYLHKQGYSWFHDPFILGFNKRRKPKNRIPYDKIYKYLKKLEDEEYPYNTIIIRYAIGADNGPPDDILSDLVKEWNEKYKDIEMIISTTSHAMHELEKKYGDRLPVYSGDFNGFWEDGVLSSSKETAISRENSERLSLLTKLASKRNQVLDTQLMKEAWKQVLLFSEHTWGAWNSMIKPDDPFVHTQWAWKAKRVELSTELSQKLLQDLLRGEIIYPASYSDILDQCKTKKVDNELEVHNPHDWPVSAIIKIRSDKQGARDHEGNELDTQALSGGYLAIKTGEVVISKKIILYEDTPLASGTCDTDSTALWNNKVRVELDPHSGEINRISYKNNEMINPRGGFNRYHFVKGRSFKFGKRYIRNPDVKISVVEKGPLLITVKIERKVYPQDYLETFITLYDDSERVYITNILDHRNKIKYPAYFKEGIHLEYSINCPNGEIRYDTAWDVVKLDEGQIEGACKNHVSINRFVDISTHEFGMSCASIDSPIMEPGEIRVPFYNFKWLNKTKKNGKFYSYLMNNQWGTNYKATQVGKTAFRYVFLPHQGYNDEKSRKFAVEEFQPLVVVRINQNIG
ncbi:MAG: hypothetical protein INQ03_24920 [Candidatus Heimdallarchaeota archaeon]|nr:hypothetical protein [Candidatus Heimdallarchaeota archaeon]